MGSGKWGCSQPQEEQRLQNLCPPASGRKACPGAQGFLETDELGGTLESSTLRSCMKNIAAQETAALSSRPPEYLASGSPVMKMETESVPLAAVVPIE